MRGRRVAYVLNLTAQEWRPQWGGYLNFFDKNWDVELAIRPRFNSLNLLAVPQWHSVSEVTAIAPVARYAITGWGRNQ
jgi:Rps23 Pro-64 3,4-dihydroxylase Tpa1-like proline 4-hydroxylase